MISSDAVYVGIDPASSRKSFSYAALDNELKLVALADGESEDLGALLDHRQAAAVAINAPSHVNCGFVRRRLENEMEEPGQHQIRGADLRVAEFELRKRGITISATPARLSACPGWVQAGFTMYQYLSGMGFIPLTMEESRYQWLETHPHACYCVLLDQIPLPRSTLEGRLQRQSVLYERGVGIQDAMSFFEEITRFRLLKGILPWDMIQSPEALDVLVAAYTAWLSVHKPKEISRLGEAEEGMITLPGTLKEKY